jgi:hypothetical protein
LLSQRFPGHFSCKPDTRGHARGLEIRCAGRSGHGFVYEASQNGRFLLALHEDDGGDRPEVWSIGSPEEAVDRLKPWAFPGTWQLPQPINLATEKRRLVKLAQGLTARLNIKCVRVEPQPDLLRLLTSGGREQLQSDLESLSPERLVTHFPWDLVGRLALKTTVLLAMYETTAAPGKDRDLCLGVVGPARRGDEQYLAVQLIDLIAVNQTHRWERAPWFWKEVEIPDREFWGAERVQTGNEKGATLAEAPVSAWFGSAFQHTPESEQAAHSLELLENGHIEEALAQFGVKLSPDLHHLLGGERIKPPACCAHPNEAWTSLLVETLRQSAPWLLARAVFDEAERLRKWKSQKKGRPKRLPYLKLAIFPGQFHARKASLMLVGDEDGTNPRLAIEATASNARLPIVAWQRPVAVDFFRRGIPFPTAPRKDILRNRKLDIGC